jgi:hypothetical protein
MFCNNNNGLKNSNAMPKIETTNNNIIFHTTFYSKNVTTSSSNEKIK